MYLLKTLLSQQPEHRFYVLLFHYLWATEDQMTSKKNKYVRRNNTTSKKHHVKHCNKASTVKCIWLHVSLCQTTKPWVTYGEVEVKFHPALWMKGGHRRAFAPRQFGLSYEMSPVLASNRTAVVQKSVYQLSCLSWCRWSIGPRMSQHLHRTYPPPPTPLLQPSGAICLNMKQPCWPLDLKALSSGRFGAHEPTRRPKFSRWMADALPGDRPHFLSWATRGETGHSDKKLR